MKRTKTWASAAILLAAIGTVPTTQARIQNIDWQQFNSVVVNQHVIPRYRHLAESSAVLAQRVSSLCQAPTETHLHASQQAFQDTLHAWQEVSHIQFGPVLVGMRNYGIEYWPDYKNIGGRQLRSALTLPASTPYDVTFFANASVAIKGLPALEHLLFDNQALTQLHSPSRRCELTLAIAKQLHAVTQQLVTEWQQQGTSADGKAVVEPSRSNTPPELTVNLVKALVEPLELISDTKLKPVLGNGFAATRPKRAESWRSGQSLTNIRANIEAAQSLYHSGLGQILRTGDNIELADRLDQRFNNLLQQLDQLPPALTLAIADPWQYQSLQQLVITLNALDQELKAGVSILGIKLGFNSLDGD